MTIRYAVSLTLLVVTAPGWSGEEAKPLVDKLVACAGITGNQSRLACFDREVAPLARSRAPSPTAPVGASPATEAPSAPAAAPPPTAPTATSSLGSEQLSSSRKSVDRSAETLHARISDLRRAGRSFVIELDNGQTWTHDDAHQGSYLKVGEPITIRKAALGSYRLTRDAGAARDWIRVTRIR